MDRQREGGGRSVAEISRTENRMRKILIMSLTGAGKTTLATSLRRSSAPRACSTAMIFALEMEIAGPASA
jgi:GTPase SAR1 family protein